MVMGKMSMFAIRFMIIFMISVAFMSFLWGCKRETMILLAPTQLLSEPDWDYAPDNKTIAILNKGENVEVLGTRFSKDAMFYKVKTEKGIKGYILATDEMRIKRD
jgi:hypothetical protein